MGFRVGVGLKVCGAVVGVTEGVGDGEVRTDCEAIAVGAIEATASEGPTPVGPFREPSQTPAPIRTPESIATTTIPPMSWVGEIDSVDHLSDQP